MRVILLVMLVGACGTESGSTAYPGSVPCDRFQALTVVQGGFTLDLSDVDWRLAGPNWPFFVTQNGSFVHAGTLVGDDVYSLDVANVWAEDNYPGKAVAVSPVAVGMTPIDPAQVECLWVRTVE